MVASGSQRRYAGRIRSGRRVAGIAVLAAAALAVLSGCSIDQAFAFGWPQGGLTPQSQKMFDLWIGSVIAALAVGVFVWGLIFWCVIRYRKRGDELPPQTRYNLPIEILYSVTPFLIISVLFYYTVIAQNDVNKLTPNPDVTVSIEAFKWNWKFSYDGVKGPNGLDVDTVGSSDYVPVLVLPENKRIRFQEHSDDVIHSFWVPTMLFKRDVFPGNVHNVFETSFLTTGAYVGRCAELCGTYHSMMNFELRVVTPEQYDAFLAAKKSGLSTPDALASVGEDAYATTTQPFPTKRDTRVVS